MTFEFLGRPDLLKLTWVPISTKVSSDPDSVIARSIELRARGGMNKATLMQCGGVWMCTNMEYYSEGSPSIAVGNLYYSIPEEWLGA